MMTREAMAALVGPLLDERGLELVEMQLIPGRRPILRVFIDSAQGVDLADCAEVSRGIARKLDALEPQASEYALEVSSPGMDRPIWSLEHFRRFRGENLRFELKEPRGGRFRFEGRIDSVDGEVVRLRVQDGEALELTVDAIQSACLEMDPWKGRR